MFFIKHDVDQASTGSWFNPATVQNYVDEDVLWTGQWRSPGQAATAIETPAHYTFEINDEPLLVPLVR